MWSYHYPLTPEEVAPEIVEYLRALWRQGLPVAELVRSLYERGMDPVPIKVSFQAAFCLDDYGDVMPIGGWFPDGTGELSEAQLHQLMAPEIDRRRQVWDRPSKPD